MGIRSMEILPRTLLGVIVLSAFAFIGCSADTGDSGDLSDGGFRCVRP